MSDLKALLARIEAAAGPDRELDCDLSVALRGYFRLPPLYDGAEPRFGYIHDDGTELHPGQAGDMLVRHLTASVDDALALLYRLFPENYWMFAKGRTRPDEPTFGFVMFHVGGPYDTDEALASGEHDAAPLAILSALLKAKLAQGVEV